ncbi:hypothetical protein MAR_007036 [Mya arenaria]|uniref:Uncharacterized protein n=1 Tax=Mya arenaria TaxID=6604 RepID=A0ABY7DHT3_MYAAR|nr:hypothetical protein MAR_007036 [Mya arenaria]
MTAETEKQPALQMVNPLSASSDYTTDITLTRMKVSAGMLRRLVSMVIQARHSVNCTLFESTIEEDIRQMKAEMENQPLLKVPTPYLFGKYDSFRDFTGFEWNEWDEV